MRHHSSEYTQIVAAARRLATLGFVAAGDGNVSIRGDSGLIISPSGRALGEIAEDELVLVGPDGTVDRGRPSSELPMHSAIYRVRPDVKAIVHTHAPYATAFAVSGTNIDAGILPELDVTVGPVELVSYATPGSETLAARLAEVAEGHDAFLLANHGLVTAGRSLEEAVARHETVEHAAKILYLAKALGGPKRLSAQDREDLRELRARTLGRRDVETR